MYRLDFSSTCRLCVQLLEKEKVSSIFNNDFYVDKTSLSDMIKYCTSVEVVEGDGLPSQICSSCLTKLDQSFAFRNQCVLANTILKRMVKDLGLIVKEMPRYLKGYHIIKSETKDSRPEDVGFAVNVAGNDNERELSKNEFDSNENKILERNINETQDRSEKKSKKTKKGSKLLKNKDEDDTSDYRGELQSPRKKGRKSKKRNSVESPKQKIKKRKHLDGKKKGNQIDESSAKSELDYKSKYETENFTSKPNMLSSTDTGEKESAQNESIDNSEQGKLQKKTLKDEKTQPIKKRRRGAKKLGLKEKSPSYICDYCQKAYFTFGGRKYHIYTMHNENYRPFICDLCGKAFKAKKNLEGHKNSIHFHLKLNLCDVCGRGFASTYALKVHKIWHNDEKNFTCDICNAKFRTRGKMNTHKTIHGGPKKFMCHICSRVLRWKKDFEIHMRTHTGEKPFKCPQCNKTFASMTNMKKHERNHFMTKIFVRNPNYLG